MTRLYVIVRQELTGGALLAHVGHAAREAPGPTFTEDERISVLVASKAQMEAACVELETAGVPFKKCIETDGPMAGVTPSIGFAIHEEQRGALPPSVATLKVWRPPNSGSPR